MFNRQAKLDRLEELAVQVKRVAKDSSQTVQQRSDFLDRAEAESEEIQVALKNYDRALAFRAASEMNPDGTPQMTYTPSTDDQRLNFGKGMASALAAKMISTDVSTKAAVLAPSGGTVVPQEFQPNVIALGRPINSLLDVLPVRTHDTPEFAYLRQTARTNAAAVVADFGTKPESTYALERIESRVVVIAHLSEAIPRYWLSDNESVRAFISAELEFGLRTAIEHKALADINAAGISTQSWVTSHLATIRKSLTKLESAGYTADSIVVAPSDWERIELSLSTVNAVEHMSLPFDASARRLYGVPIVISIAQDVGTAHILSRDAVAIDTDRSGVQLQWSESAVATDWQQNLIRARMEGRWATSVYSPLGVIKADLGTAAGS